MTQSLGLEWAPHGVRVIAIAPGYVRTPLVQRLLDGGGLRAEVILDRTPLGRMAEAEEIAELVLALTGPAFAFMTATTLTLCRPSASGISAARSLRSCVPFPA